MSGASTTQRFGFPINKSTDHYLSLLTELRGWAAIWVLYSHSIRFLEHPLFEGDTSSFSPILKIFDQGHFAVLIFFALSGATLYLSNEKKINASKDVFPFFLKRLFRIWPAYFVVFCFSAVTILALKNTISPNHPFLQKAFTPFSWPDVFHYLTLTFNLWGTADQFNLSFWSLPVEFQYYLLFPLVVFPWWKGKKSTLIVSLCFGLFLTLLPKIVSLPFARLEVFSSSMSFFGGVCVAAWSTKKTKAFPLPLFYFAALSILIWVYTMNQGIFNNPFHKVPLFWDPHFLYSLLAAIIVWLTINTNQNLTWFRSKFQWIGEISYSIYLIHMPVYLLIVWGILRFKLSEAFQWILLFPFAFIISLSFAFLSYRWIEQPSIRLGRRLSKKL